jgi:hypothetical protein
MMTSRMTVPETLAWRAISNVRSSFDLDLNRARSDRGESLSCLVVVEEQSICLDPEYAVFGLYSDQLDAAVPGPSARVPLSFQVSRCVIPDFGIGHEFPHSQDLALVLVLQFLCGVIEELRLRQRRQE